MKKRKPAQTTVTTTQQPPPTQVIAPILYPSSLCKLPSSTAIQILSQPSDRKPILIPPKMEVTIEPKVFPHQQQQQHLAKILPQPTIVKIENIEDPGDEEEEVTHFDTAPTSFHTITNSIIPTSTIRILNSSSSCLDPKRLSLSSLTSLSEVVAAAAASSSSSSSLQTTTTTYNTNTTNNIIIMKPTSATTTTSATSTTTQPGKT